MYNQLTNSIFFVSQQKYVPLEENRANLVHTSWAMMGLIHSGQVELHLHIHARQINTNNIQNKICDVLLIL